MLACCSFCGHPLTVAKAVRVMRRASDASDYYCDDACRLANETALDFRFVNWIGDALYG